jgi:hypothetical protein
MRRVGVLLAISLGSFAIFSAAALGASYNVYICGSWSNNQGPLVPAAAPGMSAGAFNCGGGFAAHLDLSKPGLPGVPNGQSASWTATAPPDITITHIYTVNDFSAFVGSGNGWWGEFFWNGGPGPAGRSSQITDSFQTFGCCQASFNNTTVGWFISCASSSGCSYPAAVDVSGVDLAVDEDRGPWLVAPYGLWQASGWVRDRFQLAFYGDSPSGVCQLSASLNGQPVTLGPSAVVGRNSSTWHQCAGASASPTIQTADYGQGPMPLTIDGCDAAGACTSGAYTKTIYVDNSHPWVSLASPGDAPVTAGTQYVTATAGGSPSGIAEIDCSVDGGTAQRFSEGGAQQPSAQVPVSGLGEHTIQCSADDTAVAQDGSHGWSASASAGLKIGEPTLSAISFTNIANKLRCSRVRKRTRVPAHWVTVRRHHRLVRVHRRAHTKVVKVTHCHPRIVKRRIIVWVTVHRHGRKVRVKRRKVIRVALPPRIVAHATRRVHHGRGTTVSGWLGTTDSVALGGQTIRVLTAPDNGLGQFSLAAVASTAANGGWTAQLPAGPSRLVEAIYDGGPTTESSISGQVRLIVPAKVEVRIVPRIVPWGSTIRITGQVVGGYVPTNSSLLRLNVGIGRIGHLEGLPEIQPDGRFLIVWKFDAGHGVLHPWFSVGTLSESAFPWAPGTSKRVVVTLGKRTPLAKHHHRKHSHAKRHRRR